VKLPAHRTGLPGKVLPFILCPFTPPARRGLRGTFRPLTKMAGYRNRMVHFYGEITEKEIYIIIQEELEDFYKFLVHVHKVLKNPTRFNLSME
jgi:hypothetical protein